MHVASILCKKRQCLTIGADSQAFINLAGDYIKAPKGLPIAHPPEAKRGNGQFACAIATGAMHTDRGEKFPIGTKGYVPRCVWIIGKRLKHFPIWHMQELDAAIA